MQKYICVTLAVLLVFTATAVAWQPETCKSCHLEQYVIWNASAHAESLEAAGGAVVNIETCTACHVESAIKDTWGRQDVETTLEPITCEICHLPPDAGYDAHIGGPSVHLPEVDLSAEMCGDCHNGLHHPTIEEWDEFHAEDFNISTMASHSEPTDVAEPFILNRDNSCVSCKSTKGAIYNLADTNVHALNLENVPEQGVVSEWRVTCVACHEPHSAKYRIDDIVLLCANCHNAEDTSADGMTTEVFHPNWEMYNGSIYDTGVHPGNVLCSDCHMATREYNDTTHEAAITGHTFDYNSELLFSPQSSNGCYDCHQEGFAEVVEAKQGLVAEKLEELGSLKANATVSLENLNGTSSYEAALEDYNNGVFYMNYVKADGSLGTHNMEKADEYLNKSEVLFNAVIDRPVVVSEPGFEAILGVIALLAVMWIVKRRE